MVAEKRRKSWAEAKHGPFTQRGKPLPRKNPAKKQRCVPESPM
jgi:hypothetical protein